MTGRGATSRRGRTRDVPRWAAWSVALSFLLLGTALVAPASGASSWAPDPVAWTNGTVVCQFASSAPTVSVSAFGANATGLTADLEEISEVRPNGSVAEFADLSGTNWTVSNVSTEDEFDLEFAAAIPLSFGGGPVSPGGSVDVRVDYLLPAYDDEPSTPLDVVAQRLAISNWTWQSAEDHLVLTLGAAPTFPSTAHLVAGAPSGALFSAVTDATNQTTEWMQPASNASAGPATGPRQNISAVPSLTLSSPTSGAVHVAFGIGAGAFTSLVYESDIGVELPATVAGIPLADFLVVLTLGGLASVLLAVTVQRVRRRPSKLIYAAVEDA
jgi:hypothetical protein